MIKDRNIAPTSLDDIVRAHRDMFEIGIATEAELRSRCITRHRDAPVTEQLYEVCFVAFRYRFPGAEGGSQDTIHLIGTKESDGNPRITNVITGIYQDSVFTFSGSHYKIETMLKREVPPEYLAVVCKSIEGTRLAEHICAPHWMTLLPAASSVLH